MTYNYEGPNLELERKLKEGEILKRQISDPNSICFPCKGTGFVLVTSFDHSSRITRDTYQKCIACNGTGKNLYSYNT